MKVLETVNVPQEKVKDVLCDKCGNSTATDISRFEHATLWADWGYDSSQDGVGYELHVCEKCFNEIISTFVRAKPSYII